ncbi:MAG: lamin tail domain-containing protein [Parcubacteria group bacterium]
MKIFIYTLIAVCAFPVVTSRESHGASASTILISEIKLSGGTGHTADEFIELYNPTKKEIEISGFRLVKTTSSGNEYDLITSIEPITVQGFGFLLITHPDGYEGSVSADLTYDTSNSIATNNTIVLYDSAGLAVDIVGFGTASLFEGSPAANPSAGKSLERKATSASTSESMPTTDQLRGNGYDSGNNISDFVFRDVPEPQNSASSHESSLTVMPIDPCTPITPTPKPVDPPPVTPPSHSPPPPSSPPNSIPSEHTVFPDGVLLNEVFPAPEGPDDELEFIEIINTSSKEANIGGWSLTDAKTTFAIPVGTSIESEQVIAFFRPDTKIALNNTGDVVYLMNPKGEIANGVEYGKAENDLSFSYFPDDGWKWTVASPNEENTLPDSEVDQVGEPDKPSGNSAVTVAQARMAEKGTEMQLNGVVIAGSDILGSKTFYLQDDTAGIKVVATKEALPQLEVGDVVSFTGTASTELGQPKMNVADVNTIVVQSSQEIQPREVLIPDVAQYPNQLIVIHGKVESIERSTIIVADEQGASAEVYVKRTTGISKPSWQVGDAVSVTGVIDIMDSGARILPRFQEDLILATVLGESTDESQTLSFATTDDNRHIKWYLLGGVALSVVTAVVVWERTLKGKKEAVS